MKTILFVLSLTLTGCMVTLPAEKNPFVVAKTNTETDWTCDPLKERYRGGPLSAYCWRFDDEGKEVYLWMTEKDYNDCYDSKRCKCYKNRCSW